MLDFQTARAHPQLGKAFSVLLDADDWDPREFEGVPESDMQQLERDMFDGKFMIPKACRTYLLMAGESLSYFNSDDICAGFGGIKYSNIPHGETAFLQANYCDEPPYIPEYAFTFYRTEYYWAYLDLELGDDSPTWWINTFNAPYHGHEKGNFADWLLDHFQWLAERHQKAIEGKEELRQNVNRIRNRMLDVCDRWELLNEKYHAKGFREVIDDLRFFAKESIYRVYTIGLKPSRLAFLLPE